MSASARFETSHTAAGLGSLSDSNAARMVCTERINDHELLRRYHCRKQEARWAAYSRSTQPGDRVCADTMVHTGLSRSALCPAT